MNSKQYARLHLGVEGPAGLVRMESELGISEDEATLIAWAADESKKLLALGSFFEKTGELVFSYLCLMPVHESGRISHGDASWLVLEGDPPPLLKRYLGSSNGRVRRYQA